MNASSFNCETCSHRHCDETGEYPGSRGPSPHPIFTITGPNGPERFYTCLLPMIEHRSYKLLDLHAAYKDRVLPLSGGMLDQPHAFMQAVRLIDRLIAELSKQ